MGIDTMEGPVITGTKAQPGMESKPTVDTGVPLVVKERVAPSSEVKQIRKAGSRTGNTEGAQDMIDKLQNGTANVPPKLEIPHHESTDGILEGNPNGDAVPSGTMENVAPVRKDRPHVAIRVAKNLGPVAKDRFGRIKQFVAEKRAGQQDVETTSQAEEAPMSTNTTANIQEPVIAPAPTELQNGSTQVAKNTPEAAISDNGSVNTASSGKFWEGFDEQFASKKDSAEPEVVNNNGQVAKPERATETGEAPSGYLQEQVAAFEESLTPIVKTEAEELQDLKKQDVEDTWKAAKIAHEDGINEEIKTSEEAERVYRSKLFGTQAALDKFARDAREGASQVSKQRQAVIDEVYQSGLKLTEKQQQEIKNGQQPLNTPEGQKQFYEKVQGAAPDRPEPGTTTSYAKQNEQTATTPTGHVGPEAAAMRAAEDKTAATYAAWKKLANAEKFVEGVQKKDARLRSLRRTALAGLIGVGTFVGVYGDDIVLAPGRAPEVGISAANAVSPPINPGSIEGRPSSPIEMPTVPMPEPPPPNLVVPASSVDIASAHEERAEGKAYVVPIDESGESISSATEQAGIMSTDTFNVEGYSPEDQIALMIGNSPAFIEHGITTDNEIKDLTFRAANEDADAQKRVKEIVDTGMKIKDEALTFDVAGFQKAEKEVHEFAEESAQGSKEEKDKDYTELRDEILDWREGAERTADGSGYSITTDDEVTAMRADKASDHEDKSSTFQQGTDEAIPNVTDTANPAVNAPAQSAQNARSGVFSRIGNGISKLFGGGR